MRIKKLLFYSLITTFFGLSGCMTVGPDYHKKDMKMPDQWHKNIQKELQSNAPQLSEWWKIFKDEDLTALITQTQAQNLNLQIALERIQEANILLGIRKGELLPTAQVGTNWQTHKLKQEMLPIFNDETFSSLTVDGGASWEIDFWGRVRRKIESASATRQGMIEDYRDALVLLEAQTASSYFTLRTLQERLSFAEKNANTQKATLKLTKDRYDSGLSRELDIHQAELNLAETQSMIPGLQTEIVKQLNLLCVLAGQYPGELDYLKDNFKAIPIATHALPETLPADLLRQRPDLRSAERKLAAQHAQIGVAKGDLYPMFSLNGSFAWNITSTDQIFDGATQYYGFGPTAKWNIFAGKRLLNAVKIQESLTRQAQINYKNTVLKAIQECENNFTSYINEKRHMELLTNAVKAAELSVSQVDTLYRSGLTDFQNVLDMQRQLTRQQDNMAQSSGALSLKLIGIYKALGGGWQMTAQTPQNK
ncbi:MAG: efflux transporter outer membrane subunit [Lentisphaeria bacterium]